MRQFNTALTLLCVAAVVGCNNKVSSEWPMERRSTMNAWIVNEYHEDAIRNGLLAEHTLYPHHFIKNGSELNDLGVHDLAILAEHYRDYPGSLNVRHGVEGDDLYSNRIETVKQALTTWGVSVDRIAIDDAHPGGDGMVSPFVVVVINEKMDQPLTPDKTTTGFFSGTGTSR